jgi:hypothetical protein
MSRIDARAGAPLTFHSTRAAQGELGIHASRSFSIQGYDLEKNAPSPRHMLSGRRKPRGLVDQGSRGGSLLARARGMNGLRERTVTIVVVLLGGCGTSTPSPGATSGPGGGATSAPRDNAGPRNFVIGITEQPDIPPSEGQRYSAGAGGENPAAMIPPLETFGPCDFTDSTVQDVVKGLPIPPDPDLGPITIVGTHVPIVLDHDGETGFYSDIANRKDLDKPGDTLHVMVGGASASVVVPAGITLTSPACTTGSPGSFGTCGSTSKGADLPLAWRGGTTGNVVVTLMKFAESTCAPASPGGVTCLRITGTPIGLTCTFPASPGQGSIPAAAMERLDQESNTFDGPRDQAILTVQYVSASTSFKVSGGAVLGAVFSYRVTYASGMSTGGKILIR